jgi:hypothetical protein
MPKTLTESGIYYNHLTSVLKEHSSYPEPSLMSHKHLCSEWIVIQSYYDEDAGLKCICGKENIHYVNLIKNRHNGFTLDPIGSSCIKRFEIQPLDIVCMCCSKPLTSNNAFLQSYLKYKPVTTSSRIVGHKKCAKTLFRNVIPRCNFIHKDFISYFKHLGVSVSMDYDGSIDMEYDDPKLTPYLDMICVQ